MRQQRVLLTLMTGAVAFATLGTAGCDTLQAENPSPRNNWGLTPLGPDMPKPEWQQAPVKRPLQTRFKSLPANGEPLVFVSERQPRAALVVAQNAGSSARQAAELLQRVFAEMSGAELPIITEDKVRVQRGGATSVFQADGQTFESLVSVGETQIAKERQISAADLLPDGYRLQTRDGVLFIVGHDRLPKLDAEGKPARSSGTGPTQYIHANGTRNGAYALLERHFGCRWLWPAEGGGEILPQRSTLLLQPLNESDEPAIAQRNLRNYYPEHGVNSSGRRQQQTVLPLLRRPYSGLLRKAENSGAWFDAMGLGTSGQFNVGHSFGSFWSKYGETHPEYFALQADGTRNQVRLGPETGGRAKLDVSNEELIAVVAQEAIEKFDADADLGIVSIAPNDGSYPSFCLCEVCRRLDPPQGDPVSFSIVNKDGEASRIQYVSLTDRYATFYGKVAAKVAEKHPDRLLGAYAYSTYSSPPLYAKLPPNVLVSFVGLSYLNEEMRQQDRRSWDAWAQSAQQLQLRPNALLGGYGLPAIFVHKLAADIKHAYATGMVGADFDALTHDWAGRGLNYYVLAKLLWDPSQDVDALIKDYCDTGFGAASPAIQEYFAELEKLTDEVAQNAAEVARVEDGLSGVRGAVFLTSQYYTTQRIEALQAILDTAKKQAVGEPGVLQRIVFLEQGMRFARVESEWHRAYFAPNSPEKKQRVLEALERRRDVFTDIYDNHFYAQNGLYSLYRQASLAAEYGWEKK